MDSLTLGEKYQGSKMPKQNRSDTLGESMETQVQVIISKNILVAYSLQRTFWRDFSYSRDIRDSKSAAVLHGGSQENQASTINSPNPNPSEHDNVKHISKKTLLTIECHKYISLNFKPLVNCFMRRSVVLEARVFFFSNHMLQLLHTCSTDERTVTIKLP